MSKQSDLFLMIREQEVNAHNFIPSKKEIVASAEALVTNILNDGEHDTTLLLTQALRLKEAITVIESKLRESLPHEAFEAYGMKAVYVNGAEMPQYEDDLVYKEMKEKLKAREELLKLALKQKDVIFDSNGEEVPKVSTKAKKGSLTIKY